MRDAQARLRVGGPARAVRLRRPGQNALVGFRGRGGDEVTVSAPRVALGPLGNDQAWVQLWDPDDERLLYGWAVAGEQAIGGPVTLPKSGDYWLTIEPRAS